jgi:hypothetical protein
VFDLTEDVSPLLRKIEQTRKFLDIGFQIGAYFGVFDRCAFFLAHRQGIGEVGIGFSLLLLVGSVCEVGFWDLVTGY